MKYSDFIAIFVVIILKSCCKTYIMTTKKLLYIHGLSSSGNSSTAKNLSNQLPQLNVISPDLPINPTEALELLREICRTELPDLVIGTSMGGMFAQQMHGYTKILVNPSFHVSKFMRKNLGVQPFLNTREDGVASYEISHALCDEYLEVENKQFESITIYDIENTYALFGEKDELVNCQEEYASYYDNFEWFPGAHRLMYRDVKDTLVPLAVKILGLTS